MGCGGSADQQKPAAGPGPQPAAGKKDIVVKSLPGFELEKHGTKKILLLGTGGCGKTTFRKQALINLKDKNAGMENKVELANQAHKNTLQQTRALLEAATECDENNADLESWLEYMEDLEETFLAKDKKANNAGEVCFFTMERSIVDAFVQTVKDVWKDPVVEKTWEDRGKYPEIEDSLAWWVEHLDRIFAPDYDPTTEDMLRIRRMTTKIVREEVIKGGIPMVFFDVGGQRSERRKWIHCDAKDWEQAFPDTVVLFIVNSASYDEVLFEDEDTNGMQESLKCFEGALTLFEAVPNVSWMCFLNKRDVLQEKLKIGRTPEKSFPDCKSDNEKGVAKYFTKKFKAIAKKHGVSGLSVRLTNAVNPKNMETIFLQIESFIIGSKRSSMM